MEATPHWTQSLTSVMKPTHKMIENLDQRIKNKPLQGGKPTLHYTNDKTHFYI